MKVINLNSKIYIIKYLDLNMRRKLMKDIVI